MTEPALSYERFVTDTHLLGPWHRARDDEREVFGSARDIASVAMWHALVGQRGRCGIVEIVALDGLRDVRSFLDAYVEQPMIAREILKTRLEGFDFAGGIRLRLHANPQKKSDALVSLRLDPNGDVDRNEPPSLRDLARTICFQVSTEPESETTKAMIAACGLEKWAANIRSREEPEPYIPPKKPRKEASPIFDQKIDGYDYFSPEWEERNRQRKEMKRDEGPRVLRRPPR